VEKGVGNLSYQVSKAQFCEQEQMEMTRAGFSEQQLHPKKVSDYAFVTEARIGHQVSLPNLESITS
jgi:hypothetical protein